MCICMRCNIFKDIYRCKILFRNTNVDVYNTIKIVILRLVTVQYKMTISAYGIIIIHHLVMYALNLKQSHFIQYYRSIFAKMYKFLVEKKIYLQFLLVNFSGSK